MLLSISAFAEEQIILNPTDDAFVLADLHYEDDPEGLRQINMGASEILQVYYSWNVTATENQYVSPAYLKFDLTDLISDEIDSATLRIYVESGVTPFASADVGVYFTSYLDWSESNLTYDTSAILSDLRGIIPITSQNWYVLDLTTLVKENSGKQLGLGLFFTEIKPNNEEIVVFSSKESANSPQLIIKKTILESLSTIPENSEIAPTDEGGGCLIATAAYGSELAPQVQQLRELRDNHLLQTSFGSTFMAGFNQLYYSFSPTIADLERENPIFRETVRLLITPLISSLSILNYIDMDSEFSVLGYGLSIIALNVGIYFVTPVVGLKITKKLFTKSNGVCIE